ncbi:precorrin-6y C5,15-methyltransferase (decarboxylating) subunit CbiE [Streptomyces radicis]|uniref:Precorrin-6y C5,15-methyltransferase (Decarboxylating) subunit CbiE n=1 Tax=Streptomyces radicis TaxID=1750517 RepID=A0A3A9WI97_9ACTN|nr:precorrin-6y C5,15-methyltransferase (decarboxylating) subunit CbiE [Streptomyces radicis]RKN12695.1 precorrin-6y C5,15-methyltransferase (decarboxylating) subunit CbiE [Streptomyces radicis]RKN27542.1 precorrin-6y C5,15-methyltransferase (decarboxylating) subunit CbiE [Streptomyces radicis]
MADRVTVIGWDGSPLDPAARAALHAATLVAGAPRHLDLPEVPPHAERVRLGSVPLAARRIAAHRGTAVVLADGDPGFFGVVRDLRDPAHGLEVEVVPAVSAVAAAFARAGMPWDDARVVVANRRTLRRAVNVCRAHPKVAVLTSPGAGPAEIALLLGQVHRTFVICEALGTEAERVSVLTSDTVSQHRWTDPNLVIVIGGSGTTQSADTSWLAGLDPAASGQPRGIGLERSTYLPSAPGGAPEGAGRDRRLRALQLAALGPGMGDLLWDVGTGDGICAVEAARLGSAVIAVDRDAQACARAETAARRFGLQVHAVHGVAPQVLEDLPEPDVIRVGGGGRRTLAACADRRPQRLVTHAMTRDQAEAAGRVLAEAGYTVECTLLQSVELETVDWSERGRSVVFLLVASRLPTPR